MTLAICPSKQWLAAVVACCAAACYLTSNVIQSIAVPATNYKIMTVGPPVGIGVMQSVYVAMAGIAKKADPAQPYVVANELICNQIARMLLLPCPPGALMTHGGQPHFFSLDFNLAGHALPPADPAAIVAHDPVVAWGIILFDAFISNIDRHNQNLSFDTVQQKIQIFDHSHALFGVSGDISARLSGLEGSLGIGGHCLAQLISTQDGREKWLSRIELIPDFFIDEIVLAATSVGLPTANVTDSQEYLKRRRDNLRVIIEQNMGEFPALPRIAP